MCNRGCNRGCNQLINVQQAGVLRVLKTPSMLRLFNEGWAIPGVLRARRARDLQVSPIPS